MNDTFICLQYLTTGALTRIGSSLLEDPQDRQPGWYVRAYYDEAYKDIRKYARITPAHALLIAEAIDRALPGCATAVAVKSQNTQHVRERKDRRESAQRAIEQANKTLAALDAEEGGRPA